MIYRKFGPMRIQLLVCLIFPLLVFGQSNEKDAYNLGVEGIKLVDEGEFKEGIKLLKQARNLDPTNYDYALEIGKAYFQSGAPKKAEKYVYNLQYHVTASEDLYLLLADCYAELELLKKVPDALRKKEFDVYRRGINKLPNAGKLYCELGKLHLDQNDVSSALGIWELGIQRAPNYSENYYWASKILDNQHNQIWSWLYGELFLNMNDDIGMTRAIAPIVLRNSEVVLRQQFPSSPEEVEVKIRGVLNQCKVAETAVGFTGQAALRSCITDNLDKLPTNILPLFEKMKVCEENGWLDDYVAALFAPAVNEEFMHWVKTNGKSFEQYKKWAYWHPITLNTSFSRYD